MNPKKTARLKRLEQIQAAKLLREEGIKNAAQAAATAKAKKKKRRCRCGRK